MMQNRTLSEQLSEIRPWDTQEAEHLSQASHWLAEGHREFHFVVYNAILNDSRTAILLVHHRATDLWLPCGGHIEPNETPLDAAARELSEELGIQPMPLDDKAFFVSVSPGEETSLHVCLWFLFQVNANIKLTVDTEELIGARWFSTDAIPLTDSDPHLPRFLQKFEARCSDTSQYTA